MASTKTLEGILGCGMRKNLLSQFNATFGYNLGSIYRTRAQLNVGIHNEWIQVAYAKAKAPGDRGQKTFPVCLKCNVHQASSEYLLSSKGLEKNFILENPTIMFDFLLVNGLLDLV
ncbi:hypothetical protein TNIN_194641 [Trichonephila inaurata madagascariensis]|uniref:Uncharacterized protein n=1 Tax=Trichonephila inaurata madagascariensis TaxID=2747483 RepID=A0A8X6YP20_9ARAC|nr:hypothetical protein TNIN_194641 [Trichonephila inaurata madagascariensis]